jgi:hypothetical protein
VAEYPALSLMGASSLPPHPLPLLDRCIYALLVFIALRGDVSPTLPRPVDALPLPTTAQFHHPGEELAMFLCHENVDRAAGPIHAFAAQNARQGRRPCTPERLTLFAAQLPFEN